MGWVSNGTGGAVYAGETPEEAFQKARRAYERERLAGEPRPPVPAPPRGRARRETGGALGVLTGYPIVYGQRTTIAGVFDEIIDVGAARSRLGVDNVVGTRNHNNDLLLGTTSAGTLELTDRPEGVFMRLRVPDTATGREALELVRRRDVAQGSFSFTPLEVDWYAPETRDGLPLAVVRDLRRLYDVTICPNGAYPQTSTDVDGDFRASDNGEGRVLLRVARAGLLGKPLMFPPKAVREWIYAHPVRRYSFGGLEAGS